MNKRLLKVSGDKDFIMSDEGLLIYYNNPHKQEVNRVFISRNQLIEIYDGIPFSEIVKLQIEEDKRTKEEKELERKYPMPH